MHSSPRRRNSRPEAGARIVIAAARHKDLARLVELVIAADEAERDFSPDLMIRRSDRRHARRSFKRTLDDRTRRTLIARAGQRVVGLLGIDLHRARHRDMAVRRYAYMHSLFVEAAWRRSGVARRLVRRGLTWARRAGAQQVRLEMAAPNRQAQRLYAAAGFRVREMMFTLDLVPIR